MSQIPEQFSEQDYINLETYKKDRTGVKTPVWFVTDRDTIYVITREKTGKVKRIKNNATVRICPCSFNGTPKGNWVSGTATKVQGEEERKAISLRKKKYGIKAKLAGFLTKGKGDLIVYAIKLDYSD